MQVPLLSIAAILVAAFIPSIAVLLSAIAIPSPVPQKMFR
jgi:hypothetical protein